MKRCVYISIMLMISMVVSAQKVVKKEELPGARITTVEKVVTEVSAVTTSSSEQGRDFPVYKYGTKKVLDFKDTYMLLVRHDKVASNPDIYLVVEVLDLAQKSTLYEMAKYMRISGETDQGRYSVKLHEINAILLLRKSY